MKCKNLHIIMAICLSIFFESCSVISSGPVENEIDTNNSVIVSQPQSYLDPLLEIEKIQDKLDKYHSSLDVPISIGNKAQERYFSYVESRDQALDEQQDIEDQLIKNGELELVPGRSYHFSLESFCVFGKSPRPVKGDGFRISEMSGPAKNYLPYMLEHYSQKKIPQDEIQSLIWGLLSGLKFDELSEKNKSVLSLFYPDAEIRFGNQAIENMAKTIIDEFIPDNVRSQIDHLRDLKDDFLKYQDNYKELESIMAPVATRSPIPLGWMKSEEGYYIKLTSESSYSKISVEIYVPDDLETKEQRSPQSFKKLVFSPWKYVALPGSGQRLAMSSKAIKHKGKKEKDPCKQIKAWKPKKCRELTTEDRDKIIKISNPENFPKTRYVSPPDATKPIEVETDCSHFTNEIYRRTGIDFPYVPTSLMRCLEYFKEVPMDEAKPGDLVLYKGHIGIYTGNNLVISATRTRGNATKSVNHEKFQPSIKIYPVKIFGNGRFVKWSCH
jgi:hypothetical protein